MAATIHGPGEGEVHEIFNVPGGFEVYMRELAAAMRERGGAIEPAEIRAIAARHDFKAV